MKPGRCNSNKRSAVFFFYRTSSSQVTTTRIGVATSGQVDRTRPPRPCGTPSTRADRTNSRPDPRAQADQRQWHGSFGALTNDAAMRGSVRGCAEAEGHPACRNPRADKSSTCERGEALPATTEGKVNRDLCD